MDDNGMKSAPKLSQYFANDPPSFFDEIAVSTIDSSISNEISGMLANTTIKDDRVFEPPEYIEGADMEDDLKVPDDIRNYWEPPHVEAGIPPMLTMPGVQSPNDLTDPIREAVSSYLSESELGQRKVLAVDDVTQDERGLRQLISAGCYRSAVNLTGRLLTIYGQGLGRLGQPAKHTPHSLQLWFTRLALLVKLGQFELLQAEADPFGLLNRSDVFFEFYPNMHGEKKGSMACFSFRLLLAEVPLYVGQYKTAMDRLTALADSCRKIKIAYAEENANYAEFWLRRQIRVFHSIINCAIIMRDYALVDDIMNLIISQTELTKEERRALLSAWGRIYLQVGDIFGAEQKFSEARRLRDYNSQPDLRDLVDKGLTAIAHNDFQEAHTNFQKALSQDPTNTMLLNNMGVCLLYSGKLKSAIALFEKAIDLNPQKALCESLLINLSTLYELESSNSTDKKLNLLRLVNKFKPDLNISLEYCLKLQVSN